MNMSRVGSAVQAFKRRKLKYSSDSFPPYGSSLFAELLQTCALLSLPFLIGLPDAFGGSRFVSSDVGFCRSPVRITFISYSWRPNLLVMPTPLYAYIRAGDAQS
jgi:hypothetical protein